MYLSDQINLTHQTKIVAFQTKRPLEDQNSWPAALVYICWGVESVAAAELWWRLATQWRLIQLRSHKLGRDCAVWRRSPQYPASRLPGKTLFGVHQYWKLCWPRNNLDPRIWLKVGPNIIVSDSGFDNAVRQTICSSAVFCHQTTCGGQSFLTYCHHCSHPQYVLSLCSSICLVFHPKSHFGGVLPDRRVDFIHNRSLLFC